jgi:hypothetical protein
VFYFQFTRDEARRAACDDNGSPERQAAEHRVRPLGDIKIAMV